MNTKLLAPILVGLLSFAPMFAQAGSIPYPNPGTINPASYSFSSATKGTLTAYFYGSTAADTEVLNIYDVTTGTSNLGLFSNQTAAIGATAALSVNAGDVLRFTISDQTTGTTLSSTPSQNADGDQHVYSALWSGGADNASTASNKGTGTYIPAGTYIGFEDTLANRNSDFNYTDEQFVFTNTANGVNSSGTSMPEPASILVLLSGIAAIAFAHTRRRNA